jgi:hypothetical protein
MRTTLDIDDNLLVRAKQRAAEPETTLTRLIEESLRSWKRSPSSSGSGRAGRTAE